MIIDKVSRVRTHTHAHTRNAYAHAYTHTREHARGILHPWDVWNVIVVVWLLFPLIEAPPQNCTPTKPKWTESQVKIPSMRGIRGSTNMFIRKDNYIINTDKIEYFAEADNGWIMVLPDLRVLVSTETVEKITNSRIRGGRNGKTTEKIQPKSNSK